MISIIIPVYNVEAYIESTIKSLLNQTYTNYELMLVDDGSRDKSIEIAINLINGHGFKEYTVIEQKNSGQGAARNAGMFKARGEWIYFMDADDLLPENALDMMLKAAESTSADITFCSFEYSKNGLVEKKRIECKTNIYTSEEMQRAFLLRKKKILVPGTLYKSEWLRNKKIVFPELRFSEDVYFLWNAIIKATRIAEVEACLYTYIVRGNSTMTSSKFTDIKESYDAFCRLNNDFQKNDDIIREVKRWMLSRWILGIMRANAGVMRWGEYNSFMKELSYREHCKNLRGFPDVRVNMMRNICLFNLRAFYSIASKRNPYI